ncbi:hypothetical protein WN093_08945 [Gammaproteobacteria bacterium AS21]|jgi:hypothetical protein
MKTGNMLFSLILVFVSSATVAASIEGVIDKISADKTEIYVGQEQYLLTSKSIISAKGIYGEQLDAGVLQVEQLVEIEFTGKKVKKIKELIMQPQ